MLALLAVVVTSIGLASYLAARMTTSEFQTYVEGGGPMHLVRISQQLGDAFGKSGSWGMADSIAGAALRSPDERVVVADENGKVVADTGQDWNGKALTEVGLSGGVPIIVDGKEVGTVLLIPSAAGGSSLEPGKGRGQGGPGRGTGQAGRPWDSASPEQGFVENVQRNLAWVGLIASTVAVVLGLLLTRHITRPVRQLTDSAQAIASGDLTQRIQTGQPGELGELASAFNTMAESLERNEKARRNLVADVAHELRTPLTIIEGTVDAVLDGIFEPSPEHMRVIKEEAGVLAKLIADLRELSLAEAGRLELTREELDPVEVAESVVASLRASALDKGVALSLSAENEVAPVMADRDRVVQILSNLLSNALRHTPEGGTICVNVRPAEKGILFAVSDNGEGISVEDLPHVFDRFYRADKSRSRRGGGTGLGLAIARQLVDAHGGRVWAESELGNGSTFYFTLPAST